MRIGIEAESRSRGIEVRSSLKQDIIACSALQSEPQDISGANSYFEHVPEVIDLGETATLRQWTDDLARTTERLLNENSLTGVGLKKVERDLVTLHTPTVLLTFQDSGNDPSLTSVSDEGEVLPDANVIMPYATSVVTRVSGILGEVPRLDDPKWANSRNPRRLRDDKTFVEGEEVYAEAIGKVCVGIGIEKEEPTIERLVELSGTHIDSLEFGELVKQSAEDLSILSSAMTVVAQDMPLQWFMQRMMPLFKAINVDGKTYRHSGSQQHTSHIADHVIWGANSEHEDYLKYKEKNTRHASPERKAHFATAVDNLSLRGSLVDQVITANPDPVVATNEELTRALGVLNLVNQMKRFRAAHTAIILKSAQFRHGTESSGGDYDMAFWLKREIDRQAARLASYREQGRLRGLAFPYSHV